MLKNPFVTSLKVCYSQANKDNTFILLNRLKAGLDVTRQDIIRRADTGPISSVGAAIKLQANFDEVERYLQGIKFPYYRPIYLSPLMLLPGGWIAPNCSSFAMYRTCGNLYTDSAHEVYEKLLGFQRDFDTTLENGEEHAAIIATERKRRINMGIDPGFVTHFDELSAAILTRELQGHLDCFSSGSLAKISDFLEKELASWFGIFRMLDRTKSVDSVLNVFKRMEKGSEGVDSFVQNFTTYATNRSFKV